MGAEGFGGWLRIWVPLIKLEGNCGGRGVWGLITKVVYKTISTQEQHTPKKNTPPQKKNALFEPVIFLVPA